MNISADACILIMAYPDTLVTSPKSFYYKPLSFLGVIQKGKTCAGHAALVLIKKDTGIIEYADFGRYITPYGKGRVRTILTDPEVDIPIKATFNNTGEITNIEEILIYLEAHPEKTHGDGRLVASLCDQINYAKAKEFISDLQMRGSIPYSLRVPNGSNCARFVADAVKESTVSKKIRSKYVYSAWPTPSPLGNAAKGNTTGFWEVEHGTIKTYTKSVFLEVVKNFMPWETKAKLPQTISAIGCTEEPTRSGKSKKGDWLGGIGAGAWFHLSQCVDLSPNQYRIKRIDPKGDIIFDHVYTLVKGNFDISSPHKAVHDCNAYWCTFEQNGQLVRFERT